MALDKKKKKIKVNGKVFSRGDTGEGFVWRHVEWSRRRDRRRKRESPTNVCEKSEF